jgi:hypothetical protein
MADIASRLRSLQSGWTDPNEVLSVALAAATHLDELWTALRWCVENDGETLADNPQRLRAARAALARATGEAS